jgi:hypothetical protein
MNWLTSIRRVAVFAVVIAAAGCSGTADPATTSRPGSSAPVPNPFTVIARYSAASLGLEHPANLAIGPNGNLYVPDERQRVTVISPQGKVLLRWGRPGSGPGEFRFIRDGGPEPGRPMSVGIAVGPDGKVYVGDIGNSRVEIFSPTGEFVGEFGSHGTGRDEFVAGPFGLTVDHHGDVYVGDLGLNKFSSGGIFQWRIGGPGDDSDLAGALVGSSSTDTHDRIFLANDAQGRVVTIDARGRLIDAFGAGSALGATGTFHGGVCSVTVDPSGNIYVTGCQESLIPPHATEVFDRSRRLIGLWDNCGFGWAPRFGPNGEVFTIGEDGSILRLDVELPDA